MSPLLPPLGLLVETVLDPYALDPDPIVSVNVPVPVSYTHLRAHET